MTAPVPSTAPSGIPTSRGRRRNPLRVVLRLSVATIFLAGLVVTIGFLVFIHRGDAEGSRRIANQEIEYLLEEGETVSGRAGVQQRNWWDYFRVTHGVLAATDRRLLYVGVAPPHLLPREPGPPILVVRAWPYDPLRPIETRRGRVFLGTLGGSPIGAPAGAPLTFGVPSAERARLDDVLGTATERQTRARLALEAERREAARLAEEARRPIYHTVVPGEALDLIARRYGTTIELLREWNSLPSDRIRIGQRLMVKPWT